MRLAIEHNRQTLLLYRTADRSYKVWFPQLFSFNKFKFSERLGFLMAWLSLNHESHKDLTETERHQQTDITTDRWIKNINVYVYTCSYALTNL